MGPEYSEPANTLSIESVVMELLSKGVLIQPEALEYLKTRPHLLQTLDIPSIGGSLTLQKLQETEDAGGSLPVLNDEGVRILEEYVEKFDMKGELSDFVKHFSDRYATLSGMLRTRPELKNLCSIGRLSSIKEREDVSVIGLVGAKRETRAGHYLIEVEDTTGQAKVLLPKNSPVSRKADEIVDDEVIAISGTASRELLFAEEVIFPDVPQATEWPGRSKNVAVMISDVHIGSKQFRADLFENMITWINSSDPVARRAKYLIVAGDIVDGVGVYKGQQKDLAIANIVKQYDFFSSFIDRISKRIQIFVAPGNHDASRDSDPQPAIPREFAQTIYDLPNVRMISSPATIQIDGITFLIYHGTALDSIIASISSLRRTGYDNPHQAMIQQLRKRHLIPIYNDLSRMFPDSKDEMIISKVPNVFHSGHVHKLSFSTYRGIRVVNSGTFQDRTAFQVKIGHHPQPGKIPYIELGTGAINLLDLEPQHGTEGS
ncbi:MAG: DNA-directed DNA polymerase II small subunit [archaeon]